MGIKFTLSTVFCSHSAASYLALAGVLSGFGLPLMLSLGVANSLALFLQKRCG
ncbi:hypothetical protein [Bacillus subtilis]|uniref:hypothetical protein n=1 Tax=Bacillus subtilis TaxID=1423 RepID=UPI002029F5B2|nr:hypothetical protein [Bacillus subtilis]MDI6583239.1 hypothetical protein [Bacillus subtilis]MED4872262.1 hypothetical protein [Bacillus subtilis]WGD82138.1 hypothetical protein P5659_07095 [Bacillus subtilis]WGD84158.1 hypothetical protein P5664_03095 [Bacillus subtilis]WGE03518.1 hypothetical protein P5651_05705 [Bacillus subtilis]